MREPSTGKPSGGGHPVSESQDQPFQLLFNRFLRVDFQGSWVTSDGGLLVDRELDECLGLTGLIQNYLMDSRTGRLVVAGMMINDPARSAPRKRRPTRTDRLNTSRK